MAKTGLTTGTERGRKIEEEDGKGLFRSSPCSAGLAFGIVKEDGPETAWWLYVHEGFIILFRYICGTTYAAFLL